MKKTVRININGLIFNLDEDAYQKLSKYLDAIRHMFRNPSEANEVISDVESRIAELFQQRVSSRKEVINIKDIEAIIEIMGKPDDFGEYIEDTEEQATNTENRSKLSFKSSRRFYRDPDKKVLSGVAAGLGAYFGIDPVIVRVIFIIITMMFGASMFIYILLWIIIPEAKTTTQKLEMRGEPVNLGNIEKTIKEQYKEVKEGFSQWQNSESYERFRNNIGEILKFAGKIGLIALKVFLVIFAIWLFFSGFGLISSFTGIWFFNDTFLSPLSWNNMNFSVLEFIRLFADPFVGLAGMIALYLFIIIPALALLFVSLKLLFRFKARSRTTAIIATALWFVSLMIIIGAVGRTAFNYRSTAEKKKVYELYGNYDTMYVELAQARLSPRNKETFNRVIVDFENNLDLTGKIYLHFIPVNRKNYELSMVKRAHGMNDHDALKYIKNLKYDWQQDDSLLFINRYFDIEGKKKIRDQEVSVDLKIPVGKVVYIGKGIDNISAEIDWSEDNQFYRMTNDGLKALNETITDEELKTGTISKKSTKEDEEIKEMMKELDTL
ncbi:MAG: PspC domain-containing protein [Bacteroidales bacterium]|nr:PspC domain-containing protein [Bacteroidales bacterium]